MLTWLSTVGIEPIRATPAPGGYTDVDPATMNDEPRLDDLEREANFLTAGEYAIDLTDPKAAIAQVQASVAAGFPVWIDAMVDSVFEAWGEGWAPGTAPLDSVGAPNDPQRGGHALLIDEVFVLSDGSVTLSGPNSWGAWGAPSFVANGPNPTGHFRVGANWFAAAVYSATIGKAAKS
jgi:hypothetical protein